MSHDSRHSPILPLVPHVPRRSVGREELDGRVSHDLVLPADRHVGLHGAVDGGHGNDPPPAVDVQGECLEGGGEVDAVAAPRAVELHQPGRSAAAHHGLKVSVVEENNLVIGVIERAASS